MAEDNNLPPIKPLELMLDENITKVDFSDFIGVWDNFMPENVCNKFIDWYKDLKNTAAITIETIMGECGIKVHSNSFLKKLRKIEHL